MIPGTSGEFKWHCPVCGEALSMPVNYVYRGMSMLCAKCAHAESIQRYYFSFAAGVFGNTEVEIKLK